MIEMRNLSNKNNVNFVNTNKIMRFQVEASGFSRCFASTQPYSVEQWTITNESGGWLHLLHIHLIDGKIIGRNINGGKPFPWEGGPKDVFYAGENESVTVLMQFNTGARTGGRYMVHCHTRGARRSRHDGAVLGGRLATQRPGQLGLSGRGHHRHEFVSAGVPAGGCPGNLR